jgi:hypothetical protein
MSVAGKCLLWVSSGHDGPFAPCPFFPSKQTFVSASGNVLQKGRWRRDEQVVVAVFSFRTKEQLTKQRIKEEVVRVKRAMY